MGREIFLGYGNWSSTQKFERNQVIFDFCMSYLKVMNEKAETDIFMLCRKLVEGT